MSTLYLTCLKLPHRIHLRINVTSIHNIFRVLMKKMISINRIYVSNTLCIGKFKILESNKFLLTKLRVNYHFYHKNIFYIHSK